MKKVSIVLPTYNGQRYLRESIRSCLEQTYRDIELVIVDDCSTDETPRILEEYEREGRVKVIRHPVNAKLPTALNTGFAHSSGSYLSWTSDDNRFAVTSIERMVGYLDGHPETGLVYTDYWIIDQLGEVVRRVSAGSPEHLMEGSAIACFLYRREVYRVVGDYDTSLFRIEDYDYWLRVAQKFSLAWHPEPLYYYRRHPSSLTARDRLENRARMFDQVQSKYFGPDPRRRTRALARLYIAEAFESHLRGDRLSVLRFAARAISRDRSLLSNRGVVSIVTQAAVGAAAMSGLRRLAGAARPRGGA